MRRSVYIKYQKQYFNSSELWVLSTTANPNLRSVDTGTGCDAREEQQQDFDENQDSVKNPNMCPETSYLDANSRYVSETGCYFAFWRPFLFRRKERYALTDSKNEIYA